MLRVLRHKLRMIGYYSAPRRSTGAGLATDAALVVALLLAVPASLACDALVVRKARLASSDGRIFRSSSGRPLAAVDRASRLATGWPEGDLIGTFVVRLEEERRGWPIVTSTAAAAVAIDIDLFDEPAPRTNVMLAEDDPMRGVLAAAILEDGDPLLAEAVMTGFPPRQHVAGWVASSALWLLMLSVVAVVAARLGWLLWALAHGRRLTRAARRHSGGLCIGCGYDLRGLEYSERCPECGMVAE